MDALEDAAFTPLDLVIVRSGWIFKGAAQDKALHLHREEDLKDGRGIEVELGSETVGCRGAKNL